MTGDFAYVDLKLAEARDALGELSPDELPATYRRRLHAYLTAGRSVLQVMRYQFGYQDLRKAVRTALPAGEAHARKAFDRWFAADPVIRTAWHHPLADERDVTVHRTGQARAENEAPKAAGVTVRRGTALRRPLVLVRDERTSMPIDQQPLGGGPLGAPGLKVGIPLLNGASRYMFVLPGGDQEVGAACANYFSALEAAVARARVGRP